MAKLILAGLLLAAGLLALPPGAQAKTNYWLGVDTTYSSWVNWSDELHIPGAGDEAVFQDAAIRHTVDTPSDGLTVGTFRFWEDIVTPYTINVNGDLYFDVSGAVTSDSGQAQFNINAGTTTFSSGTSANQAQLIVNNGTLAAGSDGAWGTNTVYVNGGGLQAASGTSPTVANQITLGGNCSFSGDSDLTLSGEFDLGNTVRTLDVSNTGTTTLSGTVTAPNAASSGIIKTGSGTLVLSGNNDYGAGTQINGGILVAGSDSALGSGGISMNYGILQAGGTGDRTLANSVTLNEKSFINGVAGNGLTLTGDITLNSYDLNVMGDGNVILSGLIWGQGGLYIFPFYGTLTVSGEENSYFGDTLLGGGTLVAASDSALGFSNLNMAGGTLQAGGTGDRTLTNGVSLSVDSSINGVASNGLTLTGENYNSGINLNSYTLLVKGAGNVTLAGEVRGTGGITLNSAGTLTLSEANAYEGLTTLTAGTLVAANDSALGSGTLQLDGGTLQAGGSGDRTLANAISVEADSYINGITSNALTLTGGISLNNPSINVKGNGDVTLAGVISGMGGITMNGAGTLTLSGENTYQGFATLFAGTLVAATDSALGSADLQLYGGTLQAGGSGDRTLANYVYLSADSSINGVASNGLTLTGAGGGDFSGIDLNSYTLAVNGAGNVNLAGQVSGTGGITMNSAGTLTLSNANNPYTGNTNVNAGTLASGANNAIGQTGATYVAPGAKVNLNAYNQTFATLNGGGELTGTGVMAIGAGDFSGEISGAGGQVVKDTTGTLTLSGESTYTGGTTITGGTLVVANEDALGDGPVKVGGSATDIATLNLTSNLEAGDFTLNQSAILQVAAGKILTLSGSFYNYSQTKANWPTSNGFNLTMSGSTFEVAGYDYGVAEEGFTNNFNLDTLTVTGNLDLVDEVNNGNRGGIHGDQEALYVNLLTGSSGSTLDLNGYWLYVFNSGDYFPLANGIYNDITVTGSPVPLPGSLLLLGSGLLGLAGWRRFRKA